MRRLNEEKKLKISQKALIQSIKSEDVPESINQILMLLQSKELKPPPNDLPEFPEDPQIDLDELYEGLRRVRERTLFPGDP